MLNLSPYATKSMSTTCPERPPRGFAIVSAIFILVVLSALASFVVSISTNQSISFVQDLQGTRAYHAARTGIEYGLARWLRALPSAAGDCASVATPQDLPELGFSYVITATRTDSGGLQFCEIVATARPTGMSSADVGSTVYIEREMRVIVEGNR